MNLGTSFVELITHRQILDDSGESSCFTLIALLLLHPGDVDDLEDDDGPKDAPDDENTFQGVDLNSKMSDLNSWLQGR